MAIKNPKTPRVTRRAKKTAALYKANPTWAKEDAMGAYRKGGSTRTLRKAQTGETGAPETVSAPTPVEDKPKDKDFVNMSNKEYRAEKKGVKRTKKLEDIASGANRERADKLLNTVGNIATTAANVTNVVSDIKNRKNNNSGGGGTPPFKKGGATKKMQKGGSNVIQSMRRNMLNNKENRLIDRGVKNMKAGNVEKGRAQFEKSNDVGYKRRHLADKYKTGGMVNANAKIAAAKKATGRSGGTTVAISKTAVKSASPKGRVGGTSTAPKKALPKAQMGAIVGIREKVRNAKQARKNPTAILKTKSAQEIPTKKITLNLDRSGPMRLVEQNLTADLKDKGKGPGGLGRNERLKLERAYYKDKKLYTPKLNK